MNHRRTSHSTRERPIRGITVIIVAACAWGCGSPPGPDLDFTDPAWSVGPSLPQPVSSFGAAVHGDAIYIAGGITDTGWTQASYRIRAGSEAWERLGDLPNPRSDVTLVSTGDSLYAVGGLVNSVNAIDDGLMFVYDVDANAWIDAPARPDRRQSANFVGLPGQVLMLAGGLGSVEHGGLTPGDTVARYDAAIGDWSYGSAMEYPRVYAEGVNIEGSVYLFGGRLQDASASIATVIELYEIATDTWSTVDHGLPTQIANTFGWVAVYAAGEVHCFGGFVPIPPYGAWTDDHVAYDPVTGLWRSVLPNPTRRASASAVVFQGQIWLMGGQQGSRAFPNPFTDAVEIYALQ